MECVCVTFFFFLFDNQLGFLTPFMVYQRKKLQTNVNHQTILLVSNIFKLFRKLTF